jgi:hypothetical protein
MHSILASKKTKQYADDAFSQQASSAGKMNMKHGSAAQGKNQHLHKCQKKNARLDKSATPLRASCPLVSGKPGKR